MTNSPSKTTIEKLVREILDYEDEIREDANLFDRTYGMDSLEFVEVVVGIEQELHFELPDAVLEPYLERGECTIADLARITDAAMSQKGSG